MSTIENGTVEILGENNSQVFMIKDGKRISIPDAMTFYNLNLDPKNVRVLDSSDSEALKIMKLPEVQDQEIKDAIVVLPSGRFYFDQFTHALGGNHYHIMRTYGAYDPQTGHISATTYTQTTW